MIRGNLEVLMGRHKHITLIMNMLDAPFILFYDDMVRFMGRFQMRFPVGIFCSMQSAFTY